MKALTSQYSTKHEQGLPCVVENNKSNNCICHFMPLQRMTSLTEASDDTASSYSASTTFRNRGGPHSIASTSKSSNFSAISTWSAVSRHLSRRLRRRQVLSEDAMEMENLKQETKARNKSDTAFRQMFETLDSNQDGYMDLEEMKRMVDGIGLKLKKSDIKRIFKRVDRDSKF